ncbi:unnamed protein product [Echinostoma caproni]|uniref:Epidermal growth factor receptor substrate 15-like 1 n=1 Tax=Echinostoma caproni TaxID=27848 RepID=A0A183B7B8_9TREM|nr:unnamed protein product [Echinostoma caproni]
MARTPFKDVDCNRPAHEVGTCSVWQTLGNMVANSTTSLIPPSRSTAGDGPCSPSLRDVPRHGTPHQKVGLWRQTTGPSAFDPFSTNTVSADNPSQNAAAAITGTDFDSVFGSVTAKNTSSTNAPDPFGTDPFGSLELAAVTGQQHSNTNVGSFIGSISAKKSPPPRPKTQPGAGRVGRERKSLGGSPELIKSLKSQNSLGSFPSISNSKSPAGLNSLGQSKHKSSSFANRVRGVSGSGLSSGRSRKDSTDPFTHQNRSNSFASAGNVRYGDKSGDGTDWAAPVGMSEEEQLSIATMESRRLAQAEEQARKQEQADLELAIQLSQMDTKSS